MNVLKVDNTAVREAQVKRLKQLRAQRDIPAWVAALDALTACARTGKGTCSICRSERRV